MHNIAICGDIVFDRDLLLQNAYVNNVFLLDNIDKIDSYNIIIVNFADKIMSKNIIQIAAENKHKYFLLLLQKTDDFPYKFDNISIFRKPIRIQELFSKIEDVAHRKSYKYIAIAPNCLFCYEKKIINYNNNEVSLTEKEADLIEHLLLAKGNEVHKDMLLKKIWNYASDISTHTLQTYIYRLRKKIFSDIILTTKNGYKISI